MEFNNREIATLILLLGLIVFILLKAKNRDEIFDSIYNLIKIFFSKHIFTTIVLLTIYLLCEIFLLYKIGFIDSSMIKDSILWSFGAFFLILKHNEIIKKPNFIRQLIIDNIKLIALFEFIINLYTFNLFIEVILMSIATLFVMMKTVMEYKELTQDEQLTLKVINFILNSIGLIVISFTIHQLYQEYDKINYLKGFKNFTLPLLLMTLYVPFYYLIILYAKYEQLFVSVNFFTRGNEQITKYLKKKIVLNCLLNYSKVENTHSNLYQFKGIDSKSEIDKILKSIYT